MSQVVIDLSSPGVDVRPIRLLNGGHHFNEVVLRDVHVPAAMLVGREEEGWDQQEDLRSTCTTEVAVFSAFGRLGALRRTQQW